MEAVYKQTDSVYAHKWITEAIGASVYFADPDSSWQRGAKENSNRQLRAYLPKRSDIRDRAQKELDNIAWELNRSLRLACG